jgi:hypothetical protein
MSSTIMPFAGSGVGGSVSVTITGATAHYHIVITGLAPGSTHAVHDHLGLCSAAARSEHLTILAVATANAGGVIDLQAQAPAFDAGADRIVLVYASAAASLITGCADLLG